MIHLWLVDFQKILGVVPRQTLAYTFSFELPRHEMYTMDDLFPGEMLVLVYDQDLLKICQSLPKSIWKVSITATCRLEWNYQLSKKIMAFSLSNIEIQ